LADTVLATAEPVGKHAEHAAGGGGVASRPFDGEMRRRQQRLEIIGRDARPRCPGLLGDPQQVGHRLLQVC
jgi:hypothetical protein